MAAPLKQTWAVKNYVNSRRKGFFVWQQIAHMSAWTDDKISKVKIDIGDRPIEISTGQYARFADGSAVAKQGDTTVLVTAVGKGKSSTNFMPLTVDYRQKAAAAGRIPTNFLRRELGPSEKETLTSRVIDRSLRPLFPYGYFGETQLMCNLMAVDGENDPDVLSINAASAALALSDIPWNGPVGAVRVGLVDNKIIINPTRKEQQHSRLNLVLTGCEDKKVVMIEAEADRVKMDVFQYALEKGMDRIGTIIDSIKDLQLKSGKVKRTFEVSSPSTTILNAVKSLSRNKLMEIFENSSHDKFSRDNALRAVRSSVTTLLIKKFPDEPLENIENALNIYTKNIFTSLILNSNKRCDGRGLMDLRNISCEVDLFKSNHGSALFQRGQTQVMCTVTFDSPDSAAKVDVISQIIGGMKDKNFMLHYEFPPYATNEIARPGSTSRRELGHGALAEKGLKAVIPEDFPFVIRLTSEVLESNGSSSMASVCGGSLALMDAGVPISEPAAGVAIGLITDEDISNYKILTDILGIEDYFGDMDFKIAGTASGVTALQADVKLPGVPLKIMLEALNQSEDAKMKILDIMNKTLSAPRESRKENGPVMENLQINIADRSRFIGLGGMNLKKLTAETGVRVSTVDDCNFKLFAHNQQSMDEAKEMIAEFLTKQESIPKLEMNKVYYAKIMEIKHNGFMVQLHPKLPSVLLHNSQIDNKKIRTAEDLEFKVGDEIAVKYFGQDPADGMIRISHRVLKSSISKVKNLIQKDS